MAKGFGSGVLGPANFLHYVVICGKRRTCSLMHTVLKRAVFERQCSLLIMSLPCDQKGRLWRPSCVEQTFPSLMVVLQCKRC